MKCVYYRISRASALFFNKNRSTQQDLEIFGAICSAGKLEIMLGGRVQAETATVRCFMKSCRQPAHLQQVNYLFYFALLCNGVMTQCDYPQNNGKMP